MEDRTRFAVYCIEEYKAAKGLTGMAVMDIFIRYGVLDYVCDYYEALHTTGRQYIVEDIGEYIKSKMEQRELIPV